MTCHTGCPTCLGTSWVCEAHPDKPFGHGGYTDGCGAPGQRCPEDQSAPGRMVPPARPDTAMARARRIGRAGITRARGLGRP